MQLQIAGTVQLVSVSKGITWTATLAWKTQIQDNILSSLRDLSQSFGAKLFVLLCIKICPLQVRKHSSLLQGVSTTTGQTQNIYQY